MSRHDSDMGSCVDVEVSLGCDFRVSCVGLGVDLGADLGVKLWRNFRHGRPGMTTQFGALSRPHIGGVEVGSEQP